MSALVREDGKRLVLSSMFRGGGRERAARAAAFFPWGQQMEQRLLLVLRAPFFSALVRANSALSTYPYRKPVWT
jgi:hypothetical protein